jgi:hypothetical protein
MALAREVAHDLPQAGLHEAVHVFDIEVQIAGVRLRSPQHLGQALVQRPGLGRGDRLAPAQGPGVGARRLDLLAEEAPVEPETLVELPEAAVRIPRVVAAPELHRRPAAFMIGSAR